MFQGLDRLSARIEAAEHRSTLAISGIDQSVLGVLSRMENAEREQAQVAARFEGALDEVRTDQARTAERLRRIEQEATGHRSAEAMRALESALNKVAGQLYEGEARTREAIGVLRRDVDQIGQKAASGELGSQVLVDAVVARITERLEKAEAGTTDAIRALEGSFASLDNRLRGTEALLERKGEADPGLEQLASELSQKVEQARKDLAEQIRNSTEGRADGLERSLREMTAYVQAAERKSAQAIEKMGQEVLQMADFLNQKVQASEHRSAEAVEQVGAEVARVASVVEQRLRRADSGQAEALEKLGSEIARITERLAERIASAERRSAHAVDDVGEQMARVTERINQRQERASSELLDRMRQSEERTARLLEEARERIERRLGDAKFAPEPAPASDVRPAAPSAPRPPQADPFAALPPIGFDDPFTPAPSPLGAFADPFADSAFASSVHGPAAFEPPALEGPGYEAPSYKASSFEAPAAYDASDFPADTDAPAFAEEDFDAAGAFSNDAPAYDATEPLAPPADFESAPTRSASTRELIAAARAAARQASQPSDKEAKPRAQGGGLMGKFGKKKENTSVRNALLASGVVAALGISAAGYVLYRPDVIAGWSKGADANKPSEPVEQAQAPQTTSGTSDEALAANLTTDVASPSADGTADSQAAAGVDSSDLYNQAKDKIKANDPAGLDMMRKAANVGYAPAQFYLAKLYEDGDAGVKKDPAEARRWTQRAAEGGDPKAMHNLGLYYFHGDGGPKNVAQAAIWFRRAADLGLVDSQYNLAQLYEQGLGVAQNPAEAYKWFLIASKSGDGESKASAERLKGQLSPSAQQAAERAAGAFRPESAAAAPGASAQVAEQADPASDADKVNLALAQKALSKLGYYKGPDDGANSPALRLAIASYQKTLGEPADGALTPDLIDKFTAITR